MYQQIQANCDDNDFSLFLQDLNYALYQLLGDHDDIYNKCFLNFLGAAWDLRNSP